jgi:transcriptional regulator with XRE-family HTH domain
MSDKSVSKWERGVCLPDVSVYYELCQILGISINEFLAGEDIEQENLVKKSEENILGIASESKRKQNRLKKIICLMAAISLLAVSGIGISLYRTARPQNFIAPAQKDSIEMETAKLLAGPDGAFIYKFTTTDEYDSIKLYISGYQTGDLQGKENMMLGFPEVGSPKYGEILIVPDFERFAVKVIIAAEGAKVSTEIPILENVTDREYYGKTADFVVCDEKLAIRQVYMGGRSASNGA